MNSAFAMVGTDTPTLHPSPIPSAPALHSTKGKTQRQYTTLCIQVTEAWNGMGMELTGEVGTEKRKWPKRKGERTP